MIYLDGQIMLNKQIPFYVLFCSSHDVHVRKVTKCNLIWHLVVNISKNIDNPKIYISIILIYVVSNVSMPVAQPLNFSATQARTLLEPSKTEGSG